MVPLTRRVLVSALLLASPAAYRYAAGDGLPDWAVAPSPEPPTPAEMARLEQGEVLVETLREDERGGTARVRALFGGDRRRAWDRLQDCEANFEFLHGLESCELLSSDTHSALSRQVFKRAWFLPRTAVVFETARQPHDWLRIRSVSGDLKSMNGYWRFDPLADGDGYLVTHQIHVRPSMPAPRWLVRRVLRRDLPNTVACLRAQVDASPGEDVRRTDEKRCPD